VHAKIRRLPMSVTPTLRPVPGFRFFGINAGIVDDTLDFGGIVSDVPCAAAGVFTRSAMPGAPIVVGREHIAGGRLQAIVVNSKNANAATGPGGIEDARQVCRWMGEACGIAPELVLPASTGVIGRRLPIDRLRGAFAEIPAALGSDVAAFERLARAIMTTDTRPKWVSATVGGATLVGVAKGAGMIEPNMATMLVWFVTDAALDAATLRPMLRRVADGSFNRISVDTDTSTSDTVVLLANGKAGPVDVAAFEHTLAEAAVFLAKEIVRDGEGATKLIELTVTGAHTADQALRTARAIINSPLVKTAIYGADPNWGRFVMAVGKVFDCPVRREDLRITFGTGGAKLVLDAAAVEAERVDLDGLSKLLARSEVFIEVQVGDGPCRERVWGCDLTEGYVHVNAHYTT
jgi:glutamate N-acetyltransferase / amino-acid N-acetyltransferase